MQTRQLSALHVPAKFQLLGQSYSSLQGGQRKVELSICKLARNCTRAIRTMRVLKTLD